MHQRCSTLQTESHTSSNCLYSKEQIRRFRRAWSALTWIIWPRLNWQNQLRTTIQWSFRSTTRIRVNSLPCLLTSFSRGMEIKILMDVTLISKSYSLTGWHSKSNRSTDCRTKMMLTRESKLLTRETILRQSAWFVWKTKRIPLSCHAVTYVSAALAVNPWLTISRHAQSAVEPSSHSSQWKSETCCILYIHIDLNLF